MSYPIAVPYKALPSADLGNVTSTASGFLNSASAAIVLPLFPALHLKNRMFEVRAWGRVEGGTTVNFTPSLYFGTSATVANDTLLKSATAAAVDSAKHSWQMVAELVWDADSDKIEGCVYFRIADVAITAQVVTAVISSADPEDNTARGFIISGLFSTSNSGNHAYLDGFQLEID